MFHMKENIVFLHGFGGSKEIWTWQEKYFLQKAHLLILDLPGHGDQPWCDETLQRMVDDIALKIKKSMFGKITIVASSLGGLIALKLYEKEPTAISKIVLVGALPKFTHDTEYEAGLNNERIDKLKEQINNNVKGALEMFVRSLYTFKERSQSQYIKNKEIMKIMKKPNLQALNTMLDILKTIDLRYIFKNIDVPLFCIFGDQDYICPSKVITSLKKMKNDINVHIIKDCGHLPFFSYPKEFNQILEKIIKGVL